jgi:ribonucleoside-triphosphate reductase
MPDWKSCANLVHKIAQNYKLPYYTISPTYSVCKNHGYISGEVYKCPICGNETEVYSRITGYYRPVKNWNDGKSKEFKMRKVYDLNCEHNSSCPKEENVAAAKTESVKKVTSKKKETDQIMLFGTKTCPNCKMAKAMLEKANIPYVFVDAEEEVAKTHEYEVTQAPTLVAIKKGQSSKIVNLSNIKKFIEESSK